MASSLGDKKVKALPRFYALIGCDTVEKFTSKSKEAWAKHFLQADGKMLSVNVSERFIFFGIIFHNMTPLKFSKFIPYVVVLVPGNFTTLPHLKL